LVPPKVFVKGRARLNPAVKREEGERRRVEHRNRRLQVHSSVSAETREQVSGGNRRRDTPCFNLKAEMEKREIDLTAASIVIKMEEV